MNPYRKITDAEYHEIRKTWGNTDAYFWHAVDNDGHPCQRSHNEYRRGVVYRNGNDLYFMCKGGPFELPKSEYRFIDGDVNVNLSYMSVEMRREYFGKDGIKEWAIKLGCDPSKLDGAPTFPEFLDIHADDAIPAVAVKTRDDLHVRKVTTETISDDEPETDVEETDTDVVVAVDEDSDAETLPDEHQAPEKAAETVECEPELVTEAAEQQIVPAHTAKPIASDIVTLVVTILAAIARMTAVFLKGMAATCDSWDNDDQSAVTEPNFTVIEPSAPATVQDGMICGMSDEYLALLVMDGKRNASSGREVACGLKIAA